MDTCNALSLKFDNGRIHSNIKINTTELVLLNINTSINLLCYMWVRKKTNGKLTSS